MSGANGLQLIGASLGLLLAVGVVAGLLPRLSGRASWLVAFVLFAAGLAAAWAWSGAIWAATAAVAVLFGQIGRHFGVPAPVAVPSTEVNETSLPALSVAARTGAATLAPAGAVTRSEPGSLGRYRIDRALGRGSMGMVYLGHDPQIDRRVAIKTLALAREFEGVELAEARTRFFREAEMAGRLQHADIVTIFDAGEEQELAFIAMEFVNGRDLQAHTLAGRLLPVAVVLHTMARVATALAYAHRQGVVHRDIKPANVMIDPESGTVKVTDFGIARVANASRTRTGMVLGTPSFMSPEQMAGREVDGRSDLYSLGVTLFQLLTGALPHESESMARLMYQIANERAPDVRSLRPDLSETLANVVALALEKRAETRYADGDQLAADLRLVAAALPIEPAMAPLARVTPANGGAGFEATLPFSRDDPRHNPGA